MGGGDLNLKKSWHPSTLRNIERVWKAEQKHEVEQQKIEELQKELAEERAREEIQTYAEDQGVVRKREQRLDWMYQGPAAMVDREDYLLGRKIDKTLELLEQHETGAEPKTEELDVGATMFSSQDLSGTATVDLANKIREDPLFNIMKKEKEQRKNLLSNPVKMKQLQQLLQQSLGKEKRKKSKKHKKCADSDSEEKKHCKKLKKEKRSRHSTSDSEDEKASMKLKARMEKRRKTEDQTRERASSNYYSKHPDSYSRDRDRTRDNSSKHSYRNTDSYSHRDKEFTHDSRRSYKEKDYEHSQKKKIDAEERERRLQEMQENAKWREQQREKNTRRYREEDEKEAKNNRMDTSDFIKPMLSKAAEKGSLENRVKQKIFSIQRGSSAMDQHFARR